jgi:hypothetical protein
VTDARNLDALFIPGGWARHTERLAARTITNYRYYWTTFVDWSESHALCALPAEQSTVLEFIKSRLDSSNPGGAIRKKTIGIILGAIAHANMQLTGERACVQSSIKYLKTLEDSPVDLQIATRLALDAFLASLPENLPSVRIKCVLLLIYEELLHMPEIVALTLKGYARPKGGNESFLQYRSVISKGRGMASAVGSLGSGDRGMDRGGAHQARSAVSSIEPRGTVTTRAMSKERLEHAISQAHTHWSGPRISALSLRRGCVADGVQSNADREFRLEQWRRNIVSYFQPMQLGWKDEPPAMSRLKDAGVLREHAKRGR